MENEEQSEKVLPDLLDDDFQSEDERSFREELGDSIRENVIDMTAAAIIVGVVAGGTVILSSAKEGVQKWWKSRKAKKAESEDSEAETEDQEETK